MSSSQIIKQYWNILINWDSSSKVILGHTIKMIYKKDTLIVDGI